MILSGFCIRRGTTVWFFPRQFDTSLESLKIVAMCSLKHLSEQENSFRLH